MNTKSPHYVYSSPMQPPSLWWVQGVVDPASASIAQGRHREVWPLHHSEAAIPLLSQLFLLALKN